MAAPPFDPANSQLAQYVGTTFLGRHLCSPARYIYSFLKESAGSGLTSVLCVGTPGVARISANFLSSKPFFSDVCDFRKSGARAVLRRRTGRPSEPIPRLFFKFALFLETHSFDHGHIRILQVPSHIQVCPSQSSLFFRRSTMHSSITPWSYFALKQYV